ncbi:hypothetical protein ACIP8Z_03460 [Streptomyces sp. NPDC088553]|uniref:hypothetical protein n=1 Tax=Streptomyces sp. NPDC088553 TaxID=3365864 RepID=UPI0038167795
MQRYEEPVGVGDGARADHGDDRRAGRHLGHDLVVPEEQPPGFVPCDPVGPGAEDPQRIEGDDVGEGGEAVTHHPEPAERAHDAPDLAGGLGRRRRAGDQAPVREIQISALREQAALIAGRWAP